MIKIGLCTIAFRDWDIEAVLELAGRIGFDGVEVWGREPHMTPRFDKAYAARVRELVKKNGLEVSVFGSYVEALVSDFDKLSEHALDIAEGLGAPIVRIWAPLGAPGSLSVQDYRKAVDQLKDFSARAAERNLVLAIESHDGYIVETSAGMRRLLDDVAAANLKVNWQASFREHADDPYDSLSTLMPYVVNVHAQNFTGPYTTRMPLSGGALDYRRVISQLKETAFDRYVEIEFVGDDDAVGWLKRDFEYLKRLAEEG